MLKKIEKLESFGIFKDFKASSLLAEYVKYNLFYGNNGSGKSTLSRLFRNLSPENSSFPDSSARFSIKFDTGNNIDEKRPKEHGRKIQVFDEEFVKVHIDWDNQVKSILLVSEEKIKEKKEYEQKTKELEAKGKEDTDLQTKIRISENEISKFLSSTAKQLKLNLQVIATSDSRYLNYNKTKLESLISRLDLSSLPNSVLADDEVESLVQSASAELKSELLVPNIPIDENNIVLQIRTIHEMLQTKIVGNSIQRLKDNPEIAKWVKEGITIAKEHKSNTCEFCGQLLPSDLFTTLESHFNDVFELHISELLKLKERTVSLYPQLDQYPNPAELYPEMRDNYKLALEKLSSSSLSLQKWLESLVQLIVMKIANPFSTVPPPKQNQIEIANVVSDAAQIVEIMQRHNKKTTTFKDSVTRDRNTLETHFASSYLIQFDYQGKKKKTKEIQELLGVVKEKRNLLSARVEELEKLLSSETLGANKFNAKLHKFLGHKEIELSFSRDLGGYKILRYGQNKHATKLSEGEKNAIAFIYFATKIREKGSEIEDSILVIDDPVSSLDSHNIFHAFSFLRREFSTAKQLFILTHNFLFFRLVRDWILGKNKKNKPNKGNCYQVTIERETPRKAFIENAHSTLEKYNTEYHFIFSQLFCLSKKPSLTLGETFFAANLSRKLLEAFLNFKLPRKRSNFRELMDHAIQDKELVERVYRFINMYSHYTPIGATDGAIESLVAESPDIIKEVLTVIQNQDENHYNEMVEIV